MNECTTTKSLRCRTLSLFGSATTCVVVATCFVIQPDRLAPVTLFPPWCWLVVGLMLTILGYRGSNKLRFVFVLALWCVFTALFVEESQSLLRVKGSPTTDWQSAHEVGLAIRVVSLNCQGSWQGADEVSALKPDIVLFQESPGSEHLAQLSKELFGAGGVFLDGGDTSIVAHGKIEPKTTGASHFTHANVKLSTGITTNVMSLRLAPPAFRLDFWTAGFWVEHFEVRIRHRQQILDIVEKLEELPESTNLIVGGDFNSAPGDGALSALRGRVYETFRKAGCGWGCTGTNEYPLFRVDQIWVSRHFEAETVVARKTRHSDHRMVVCDLILKD